ncbi:hypothetical protein [Aridibaculum aurantiacum]|uniref:hypothetical protein n=1 Tax=Aridibaculum aurantiacum TaxID=2810307 RepID=UPI001A968778|nr:hypothetical protein [Aridibaculum aurantiacum]
MKMYETFKGKRVIWESKTKWIKNVITAVLFVCVILFARHALPPILFWLAIIFFGGMGTFALVWLLHPKNLFVSPGSQLGEEILDFWKREKEEDYGSFSYTANGFSFKENQHKIFYKWNDIETVFAHEEEISYDQMCLDIFMHNGSRLEIMEETPGWYKFKERLIKHVSLKPFVWDKEEPGYDPELTLLYDKKGRTLEEAEEDLYND